MPEQVSVSPWSTGSFAAMAWTGVSWRAPPKGMTTVAAPMVESNHSLIPFLLHTLRSVTTARSFSSRVPVWVRGAMADFFTRAAACFSAPLEFRKSRDRSTMRLPCQSMVRRGASVTTATLVASRFSRWAMAIKALASWGASTTAIRSWLSLMASSVPSRPSYFLGTASRSMARPSASSPMATDTPPAPKSLHRLMRAVAAGSRNSRWSFRSSGALPFWTSAPQVVRLSLLWLLEEPVAPPQPSRPVRPPSSTMTSPGAGTSRRTFFAGAAPTTAPISIRLAA